MDVFSKSKPELISSKTMKNITKMLKSSEKGEPQWSDNLKHFYINYIRPNLFPLIVLLIVMVFLIIRYTLKKEKQEEKKKKKKSKKKKHKKHRYIDEEEIDLQQSKPVTSFDDLNFEEELISGNDENSILNLEQEYQKSLEENRGILSEQMIRDMHNEKVSKMSFDEIAKIITSSD